MECRVTADTAEVARFELRSAYTARVFEMGNFRVYEGRIQRFQTNLTAQ